MSADNFISRYGLVTYSQYVANRGLYEVTTCEWCVLVADHCHVHQQVRGICCNSHNARMKRMDSNGGLRKAEAWQIAQYLRCVRCAEAFQSTDAQAQRELRNAILRFPVL